jgi:DNA-binding transcriptional ArsR family regulator
MTPQHLDQTFAALADPTRRAVIELLRNEPQRSSDMADALSVPRPAMSRHLRVLREAGLVEESSPEEDARVRIYQLRRAPFTELRTWIEDVEAFWSDQLAAFKAHAERSARKKRR